MAWTLNLLRMKPRRNDAERAGYGEVTEGAGIFVL